MKKIILITLSCIIWSVALSQNQPNILIVYYSAGGHTKIMAEAVERGARSVVNVSVKIASVEKATNEDALAADAIIIGSPVYNANVAPPVQEFINKLPFKGAPLRDKLGAAFVTAGGVSAGEELTQLSILHSMMIFGMIVVGGPEWTSAFGASAITNEEPFKEQSAVFLKKGEALGRRVAELAVKWQHSVTK